MYSILLTEDEKWVRIALKKVIEKTGLPYKVVYEATNGIEASDWLKANKVDLVMTDIRMPVMDGVALLEDIRGMGLDTEVVVVSGHDDFGYAQKAIRLGVFDYLLKPVESDNMKACLQRWQEHEEHKRSLQREALQPEVHPCELSPIESVIKHIHAYPESGISLSEAAAQVHLNPSYLCKLFKQQTGVNFKDYVTTARMTEAGRLLEKTTMRVTEIAERLGYGDLAYFSNTFKKIKQLTPSEYRKQAQGAQG